MALVGDLVLPQMGILILLDAVLVNECLCPAYRLFKRCLYALPVGVSVGCLFTVKKRLSRQVTSFSQDHGDMPLQPPFIHSTGQRALFTVSSLLLEANSGSSTISTAP